MALSPDDLDSILAAPGAGLLPDGPNPVNANVSSTDEKKSLWSRLITDPFNKTWEETYAVDGYDSVTNTHNEHKLNFLRASEDVQREILNTEIAKLTLERDALAAKNEAKNEARLNEITNNLVELENIKLALTSAAFKTKAKRIIDRLAAYRAHPLTRILTFLGLSSRLLDEEGMAQPSWGNVALNFVQNFIGWRKNTSALKLVGRAILMIPINLALWIPRLALNIVKIASELIPGFTYRFLEAASKASSNTSKEIEKTEGIRNKYIEQYGKFLINTVIYGLKGLSAVTGVLGFAVKWTVAYAGRAFSAPVENFRLSVKRGGEEFGPFGKPLGGAIAIAASVGLGFGAGFLYAPVIALITPYLPAVITKIGYDIAKIVGPFVTPIGAFLVRHIGLAPALAPTATATVVGAGLGLGLPTIGTVVDRGFQAAKIKVEWHKQPAPAASGGYTVVDENGQAPDGGASRIPFNSTRGFSPMRPASTGPDAAGTSGAPASPQGSVPYPSHQQGPQPPLDRSSPLSPPVAPPPSLGAPPQFDPLLNPQGPSGNPRP